MYEDVPLDALTEHPLSTNRISRAYAKKLRHTISELGRYETLTVRPHPTARDQYEVLNGHARLAALRDLGAESARCDVWRIGDEQARLFLSVLNKLRGSEVPELRMDLLLRLLEENSEEELAECVPESRAYLMRLNTLADRLEASTERAPTKPDVVVLSFYLSRSDHNVVSEALERLRQEHELPCSSAALVKMAEEYLRSVQEDRDIVAAV